MSIQLEQRFTCDAIQGKELIVSKIYNERLFVVKVEGTERTIACSAFPEPKLMLAHLGADESKLTKVKK